MLFIWGLFVAMSVISAVSHLLCRSFWRGVGWSVLLFGWLHTFVERGGLPYYPSNPGAIPIAALAVTLLVSAGLALACARMMPRWRSMAFWVPAIGLLFVYVVLGDSWYRTWLAMALLMYTPIRPTVGIGLAVVRKKWCVVILGTILSAPFAVNAWFFFYDQFYLELSPLT